MIGYAVQKRADIVVVHNAYDAKEIPARDEGSIARRHQNSRGSNDGNNTEAKTE